MELIEKFFKLIYNATAYKVGPNGTMLYFADWILPRKKEYHKVGHCIFIRRWSIGNVKEIVKEIENEN